MATPGQLMFARRVGPAARLFVWILLGFTLVVLDARLGALDAMRAGLSRVMQPVQRVMLAPFDLATEIGGFLVRHRDLQLERDRLLRERVLLHDELNAARDVLRENQELRGLLALQRRPAHSAVAAGILYQGQDWFSHRVTIDHGAGSGLRAGQPVVDTQGLVGQVTRVFPDSSEVALVSNSDQLTPAFIQRTGQRALVAGSSHAGLLEIRFLPVHADVRSGDLLLTSGIDRVYPPGLPVARVTRVQRPQGSPYARIEGVALAGIARDRALLVLTPIEGDKP
jgi:rod shape-determining protein MreC